MEHFATDALFPEFKIWEKYTTDAMSAAQRLDSLRSSHPIQVPIGHAEEVEQVFDAISYCKGSTVVRMVAAILGPDKFREGLQIYMNRFKYSNTVTLDLWNCWSEVSGIDIPTVMATWTQQMGYPYLTVKDEKWTDTEVTVTLEQHWFLADGTGKHTAEEERKLWNIPLLFDTSDSVAVNAVIMSQKTQTFSIPLNNSHDWLRINAGQQALVRVALTPTMTHRLQRAISTKKLPPIDRAALLLDAYALAKAGDAAIEDVVDLLRAYTHEDNDTVWGAISGALQGLHILMEDIGGPAFAQFTAFGARIVKDALNRVGWSPRPTDTHSEKLMRSTLIGLLDSFGSEDPEIYEQAKQLYDAHWTDHSVLSSDFKVQIKLIELYLYLRLQLPDYCVQNCSQEWWCQRVRANFGDIL
jgi:puromycin-sensitive aminopeptidase